MSRQRMAEVNQEREVEHLAFSNPEREIVKQLKLFSSTALIGAVLVVFNRLSNSSQVGTPTEFLFFGVVFVGSYFLWVALGRLSSIDTQGFAKPTQLTFCSVLGAPIISVGYVLLTVWGQTISSSATFGNLGLGVLGALVFLVGGVFLIVGLVGEVIGLWRMGASYHSISLKQGSLLFFIPFIGIIGAGLLLRGSLAIGPNPNRVGHT
jgi:hypothetical protein